MSGEDLHVVEVVEPGEELEGTTPAEAAPRVPAGGAAAVVVDPERLPSVEKIRRGLATRR